MRKLLITLICIWFILFLYVVHVNIYNLKDFKVVFLNIGQGDSTLITFQNKEQMLIDCGKDKKVLAKLGQYIPFYDRTLEYLVISHYDLDHYGGCIDVLKRYKVKNIVHNGSKKADKYFKEWQYYKKLEGANEIIISQQTRMNIANSAIQYLSPVSLVKNENNNSVVLKIINGANSFLFTGDIEEEKERDLISVYCTKTSCLKLQSDYLKVSHHGSPNGSSKEFLEKVKPHVSIISVGKNSYGHPSERVINKLKRVRSEIYRTDKQGDIKLP